MPVQPFPGERNWGYDGVAPVRRARGVRRPRRAAALRRPRPRARPRGLPRRRLQPPRPGGELPAGARALASRAATARPGATASTTTGRRRGRCAPSWSAPRCSGCATSTWTPCASTRRTRSRTGRPRHLVGAIRDAALEAGRAARRAVHVVAEDDRNDRRVLDPPPGGWGASAVWADDLHHALHALLTGEPTRFLADFGRPEDVARALAEGLRLPGAALCVPRAGARHRSPAASRPVVLRHLRCRTTIRWGTAPRGERLSAARAVAPRSSLRPRWCCSARGSRSSSWARSTARSGPFLYFTSHGDPALAKAVSEGRRQELIAQGAGEVPDPQDAADLPPLEALAPARRPPRRAPRPLPAAARREAAAPRRDRGGLAGGAARGDGVHARPARPRRAREPRAPAGGRARALGLELEERADLAEGAGAEPPHAIVRDPGHGLAP